MFWKKKYPCVRQHDQSDCAAAYVGMFVEVLQIWINPVKYFVEWLDEVDGNKNGWIF